MALAVTRDVARELEDQCACDTTVRSPCLSSLFRMADIVARNVLPRSEAQRQCDGSSRVVKPIFGEFIVAIVRIGAQNNTPSCARRSHISPLSSTTREQRAMSSSSCVAALASTRIHHGRARARQDGRNESKTDERFETSVIVLDPF